MSEISPSSANGKIVTTKKPRSPATVKAWLVARPVPSGVSYVVTPAPPEPPVGGLGLP